MIHEQLHIITNHPTKYQGYQTNHRRRIHKVKRYGRTNRKTIICPNIITNF